MWQNTIYKVYIAFGVKHKQNRYISITVQPRRRQVYLTHGTQRHLRPWNLTLVETVDTATTQVLKSLPGNHSFWFRVIKSALNLISYKSLIMEDQKRTDLLLISCVNTRNIAFYCLAVLTFGTTFVNHLTKRTKGLGYVIYVNRQRNWHWPSLCGRPASPGGNE